VSRAPYWIFRGTLARVVDGDTVDVLVDLGFRISAKMRFRVAGIDTPELEGPTRSMGQRAADRTLRFLAGAEIEIASRGEVDKYGGRWDGDLSVGGVDLAETLVREGWAQRYTGAGPRPLWDPAGQYPRPAAA